MASGIEADGLETGSGRYSFFREMSVADGVMFGTAQM
jgi:hypothetical protein